MSTTSNFDLTSAAPSLADTPLDYAIVDVFAERPLEGNQLAVFADGRGLNTEQMQAIAREMNLSETTFILPDDVAVEEAHGVRVRIFTTGEELPFAGHPTLGTASWLYWHHPVLRVRDTITLRLQSGPVEVRFTPQAGRPGIFATMSQGDPVFGDSHPHHEVAEAQGVPVEALDRSLPVQTVSTGMAFCIVPFVSVAALSHLAIPQALAQRWLDRSDAKFFYCIAPVTNSTETSLQGAQFEARMQFYNGEDPATGSAAGCAISWLVGHGMVASETEVVIAQGVRMLRPARIYVQATKTFEGAAFKMEKVRVSGRTIHVAAGRFFRL